ncbi:hypothetical protein ABH935_009375 [Catenulispora sp. GAS73]|uniref:DUF2975 domain-containing protein n=1 Tax=Catenulispora sp. GAS73 TaxID=3156269 RepID=UPI0035110027
MASFLDTIDFRYGGTVVDGVAKKRAIKVRNPLEPLMTFNWMVLCLVLGGFVWDIFDTLFGGGSILGYGHQVAVCADTGGMGARADSTDWLFQPRAGVTVDATHVRLCTDKPSAGQRWWYTLDSLPGTVTLIGVVVITFLALTSAHRKGLYTPGFAARLRLLGWFLVVDSVLRPTVEVYASGKLWTSLAAGPIDRQWNVVWIYLFAGLALLSLARIMRVGNAMREDLEGVV